MFNFSTIVHATDIAGIQTPARHLHTLLFLLGSCLVEPFMIASKLGMPMKNKYAIRSKISEAKIRQIVRLFAV
ncbi:MAG: hypothetical protein PHW09_10165, partial [Desulfovibrio desulfuricans]|nr:hypothetical protein [Desulfovibrio desulfuricans]